MNTIGERIAHYRKEKRWSQQALAERCGWPTGQSRVANYEKGLREPNLADIETIAKALGVGVTDLVQGGARSEFDNLRPVVIKGERIKLPLVSWVTAGEWCAAEDPYSIGNAEDWLESPFDAEFGDILLRVAGESMTVPDGSGYGDGEIIHVKGRLAWKHNDDVIVRDPSGKATFKRIKVTPEGNYLEALNPNWPDRIIRVPEGTVVCGVVVGSWRDRRR